METLRIAEENHVSLIFLDPPFNTGEDYEYQDKRPDYYQWMERLIKKCADILSMDGSLWINCPDQHAAKFYQDCLSNDMKLENWCIWHYRFAQCQPSRFLRSKTHVLWFSHGTPFVNAEFAKVPSDRATTYNDPRILDYESGGMRMDFDVWGFDPYWGRIQGNNKERVRIAPNQIPEKYLERIIGVTSKKDDFVVDPFSGSGTTCVVADRMGRSCCTGDLSLKCCEATYQRLLKGAVRV